MQWILSLHVIFMVTWFAGIFYLPRLFVYHADTKDEISNERFKIMERRLFYGIMTPGGVLTTFFGIWLIMLNPSFYLKAGWLHTKLLLVLILWGYHLYCGCVMKTFKADKNQRSAYFYRWFNEIPIVLLFGIVMLAIIKP